MSMYSSIPAPWDSHAAEAHAFDTPYEVIKGLKKEIAELKAGFQAEQHQRAVEIQQLRTELVAVKETLGKERAERTQICHQLATDMTTLRSDKLKAVEELKVNFSQALSELNNLVQDEVRDRKNDSALRDTREQAERSERITEAGQIKDEMAKFKQVFFNSRDDTINKINDCCHDIDTIATAMQKVSTAKAKLSKDSLQCYRFFDGSNTLSS